MEKSSEGLMLWQKVGLFVVLSFPVVYIFMLVFSNQEKNVEKPSLTEKVLQIKLDNDSYKTGEKIVLTLLNISDRKIYFRKPCEGLPPLKVYSTKEDSKFLDVYTEKKCKSEFSIIDSEEKIKFSFYPELYKLLPGEGAYQFSFQYSKDRIDNNGVLTRHDILGIKEVSSKKITIENLLDKKNPSVDKKCETNNECEMRFSNCTCGFDCVAKNSQQIDCDRVCDESNFIQREMVDCGCMNGECTESEPKLSVEEEGYLEVKKVLDEYFRVEKECDKTSVLANMSRSSRKMVNLTCNNMKREVDCNGGAKMNFKIKDNSAVAYIYPLSYESDNPYFFLKEEGEWRLDLSEMAKNLTMKGGSCEGWTWRTNSSKEEFCFFFEEGSCPADNLK